jgi:tetratricopeptide (TPR) repeat protein
MTTFAQLAEREGNIEQARGVFREAIAKWPTDVELLRATARLEDRQGQLGVAEALYRRAVELEPQHAGAYNDLGLCLARQGKLEQSVQAIEQGICLQPDKALYRNNAATVLVELRQDQKALAHLSAVHGPAASNYNLGQLLVARSRTHEAVPYFQAAVEMDPTMEPARVALAQATGIPVVPSQVAAESIPITPTAVPPSYGPQLAPQQSAQQPMFPATARGPAWNASTSVAPATAYPVYAPSPAPTYQTAAAPRYLPPVQTPPAGTVR